MPSELLPMVGSVKLQSRLHEREPLAIPEVCSMPPSPQSVVVAQLRVQPCTFPHPEILLT